MNVPSPSLLTVVLLPIPPDEASVELRPFEGSPLDPLVHGHMRIYACICTCSEHVLGLEGGMTTTCCDNANAKSVMIRDVGGTSRESLLGITQDRAVSYVRQSQYRTRAPRTSWGPFHTRRSFRRRRTRWEPRPEQKHGR